MNALQLCPSDCSPLGQLVLAYLEQHPQTNMSQLARQIGLTRGGLGLACLRHSTPTADTATKITMGLGAEPRTVARLVYENRLATLAQPDGLDYIAERPGLATRKVPLAVAIAAMNAVFAASCALRDTLPTSDQPSDFTLYKRAYD